MHLEDLLFWSLDYDALVLVDVLEDLCYTWRCLLLVGDLVSVHLGGAWRLGVGQSESCMVCLSFVLSLTSTKSLIEVLMSTMSLTVVFECGLVPGLGPLWSPLCMLVCVESGRPFPQIKPKFEATWSP